MGSGGKIKKIACSIDLHDVVEYGYERVVMQTIHTIISNAIEYKLSNIQFILYYSNIIDYKIVQNFIKQTSSIANYVNVLPITEFQYSSVWMAILKKSNIYKIDNYRQYYIANDGNSLLRAIFNYYDKVKLQINITKTLGTYEKKT